MKLELKHLAPYLPYGLNVRYLSDGTIREMLLLDTSRECYKHIFQPAFRPLSDLTKEIEVSGEKFVPMVELFKISRGAVDMRISEPYVEIAAHNQIQAELGHRLYFFGFFDSFADERIEGKSDFRCFSSNLIADDQQSEEVRCNFQLYSKLLEWHFDVFGLIEKGLAVDINTLTHAL